MKIKKPEQVVLLGLAILLSCSTPNTSGIEMGVDMRQEEIAETSS
jgi:hypothetical protein